MRRKIARVLCIAMLLAVCAGCAENGDAPDVPTPGGTGDGQGRDTVKVVLEDSISTLNVLRRVALLEQWALEPINGYLVTYNAEMEVTPSLAENWNVVSDTEIQFKLREAYFHDGKRVTPEDVKFTLAYIKDEKNGSVLRSDAEPIREIRVDSDSGFTVVMEKPYARVYEFLTNMAIISAEHADTLDTAPVGCGPYRFVKWDQDQYLELEAFDKYWDEGKPASKHLIFNFIPEYNTARTALLAGEVDVILYADPTDIEALKGFKEVKTDSKPITGGQWIGFNCAEAPFDDLRVRQAVNYAVDRAGIIAPIYHGNGTVLYSYFDGTPYAVDYFKVERDVEKAKQLLRDAGYPDGLTVTFTIPNTATEGPMGELVAAQLAEAGIRCEIEKMDVTSFLEKTIQKHNYSMFICGDTGAGDPDYPTYNYTVSTANNACFNWVNAEYDALMEEGRAHYTVEERKAYYDPAFQILAEEIPWIVLCIENRTAAMRTDIEGFLMKSNLRYDFASIRHAG